MRKKGAKDRVEAVSLLAKVRSPEAVDLILKKGVTDGDEQVRKASREALTEYLTDPKLCKHMTDDLKRQVKKPVPAEYFPELIRCLANTEEETQQVSFVKLLDEYLASPKSSLLLPMTIIDELGKQGDETAFISVKTFARSKAFDAKFGYQRCIIQALIQIPNPAAVKYLIVYLPNARGLIQYDIVQYLTKLTSQKFGDNDRLWYKWWDENGAKFEFPKEGLPTAEVDLNDGKPTYYGIPVCAKRVVFVLDTSGSMRGAPIEAAKRALIQVIETLPDSVSFDVVLFDKTISVWQPRLLPATRQAKDEVRLNVMGRGLGGATHSFAAIDAAFRLEPEAIYFLSDGKPTDSDPDQIFNTFFAINRERRVSLHTIGLVTDRGNAADLILFMKPLAEKNWGTYRLVE